MNHRLVDYTHNVSDAVHTKDVVNDSNTTYNGTTATTATVKKSQKFAAANDVQWDTRTANPQDCWYVNNLNMDNTN